MTQSSIRYYRSIGEFKNFVQRIDDKTLTVAEAFSTLRETASLSKATKEVTIQQLVDQPKLIVDLASELRKVKEAESRFKLPYKIADREQELIQDLADIYEIDTDKAKAKILLKHYKDYQAKEFPQEFNYCLEAVIAPRTDLDRGFAGQIGIIASINSTLSPDIGETYFSGNAGTYTWYDKKGGMQTSASIREILAHCGYNLDLTMAKRRVPSILYINLNTPCPRWQGSAGKTHIDLRPYASDIAETVKTLAYKMPSYYGQNLRPISQGRQKPAIEYLQEFIIDRYNAIYDPKTGDLSLIYRDPLTQSGVWYRLRPNMIDGQYQPEKNWGETRKWITGEIDKQCKNLRRENNGELNFTYGKPLGIEREDLGIYAKAKGMMLYDGRVYPVSFETFEALGAKGVFILVIEKENIADVVKDEARGSGIALVHTGGRFTKDVKKLIDKATVPIATLTDYDYDGIKIAEDTIGRSIPRIGIDKDIIDWLQQNGYPEIRIENVQEEYRPRGGIPDDEYLRKYRIELDSITAAFPDSPGRGPEALWKHIVYKIEELQKKDGFNYSNVVKRPDPDELYPEQIDDLITKLHKYFENITADDWEILKDQLVAIIKLSPIKEMKDEIVKDLTDIVSKDEGLSGIIAKVEELGEELDELLTDQEQEQKQD